MRRERSETSKTERLTLTVEEAAHLLGISRGLAYEMARRGKLPVVRFGRRLLIPRRALGRMLDQPGDGSHPRQ
jgi:excisionase family DNA binding protein